uniref:Uncharacterized protein n=1 Tax=Oryza rufipogon TaxID=4529 RepID=A0A0E0NM69_ORYRU
MAMIIEGEGPSKTASSEELEGGFSDYYRGAAWLLPLSASSFHRVHQLLLLQSLAVGSGYQPVNNRSSLYEMGNVKIIAATYGWKGTMIATGITVIEAKEDSIVILNILMIAIGLGTMILKVLRRLENNSIQSSKLDVAPLCNNGKIEKAAACKRGIERRNTPKEKEKSEGKHQGDIFFLFCTLWSIYQRYLYFETE